MGLQYCIITHFKLRDLKINQYRLFDIRTSDELMVFLDHL